jgi:hypothetical protein
MPDLPPIVAALKDFVPLGSAAIGAGAGYAVALVKSRSDEKRLDSELDAGTGRDPKIRAELYGEYLVCLDRFYEPGERTTYFEWLTSYSTVSTRIKVLGKVAVAAAVEEVTEVILSIGRDHLARIDDQSFEQAWYDATKLHQPELDQAREHVLNAMQADVGAVPGS